jgi:hypothetical protein
MRDLCIHENDLIVATHGRSFWILDDITPLRELADSTATTTNDHLFTPAPSYRVQRDTNTDTPLPPDEPAAANPPDGAVIDYYLARSSSTPVTLEILDARGQLVRKFSSTDQPDVTEAELKKQLIPLYWLRPSPTLSSEAGVHRWIWDLHYPTPESTRHGFPIAAVPGGTPRSPLGPTALPGSYTARLTANGKSYSAPFRVKMDSRVHISAAGLEKKFQLESRLAALLSQTSKAVMQAGSIHEPLEKLTQQAKAPTLDSVKAFQNKLNEIAGAQTGFFSPASEAVTLARVNGQLSTLYGQVGQVDAEPTAAQSQAIASTERDTSEVMKRWEALEASDLPALNQALRAANLPEIKIDSDPHKQEASIDEE